MAEKPTSKPPVESIPSRIGEISAIASSHASFLYFDAASNFGFNEGIVNVTLEAARYLLPVPNQGVTVDRVVVAHLRMSVAAAASLREALEKALLMAAPVPNDQKN